MSSSPLRAGASREEELDYYKKQYEILENDLAEFQASSKELEEQLERDIEGAEKKERKLKEQVEKLNYEVDEWKTKHKQAKAEANSAQNALQKEITTMRETNRTLQLKLRDIEVVNDDYERQARNTESSLEDMESKYNVAIERGVMLEEEIKVGEQEREALRIETQRLRDELGDLKVESEITLEKLRAADDTIERLRSRKPSPLAVESLRTRSPGSEASGLTPSSPTASTPPPKSDAASDVPTPPSPPLSDGPVHAKVEVRTPLPASRTKSAAVERKASTGAPRLTSRHAHGPSLTSSTGTTTSDSKSMRPPATRVRPSSRPSESLPRSESLYQIKALRGRMQKIEERVHSARSKLPAPSNTTPRGSPRTGAAAGEQIPSSVTLRRSTRRPISMASSSMQESENDSIPENAVPRRESQVSKRLSFGIPRPTSSASARKDIPDRPPSSLDRPPSAAANRPSSRTSMTGGPAAGGRTGARTPVGGFYNTSSGGIAAQNDGGFAIPSRPRSSIGGNYSNTASTPRLHRPSASIGELRRKAESDETSYPSPGSRRNTADRRGIPTALPLPSGLPRRQSGGLPPSPTKALKRRESGLNRMDEEANNAQDSSNVGETY